MRGRRRGALVSGGGNSRAVGAGDGERKLGDSRAARIEGGPKAPKCRERRLGSVPRRVVLSAERTAGKGGRQAHAFSILFWRRKRRVMLATVA